MYYKIKQNFGYFPVENKQHENKKKYYDKYEPWGIFPPPTEDIQFKADLNLRVYAHLIKNKHKTFGTKYLNPIRIVKNIVKILW